MLNHQPHVRNLVTATLFLAGILGLQAQEQLSREEALKYACIVSLDLKEMLNTPIRTDPDIKRPAALRHGGYGGLVLPEAKLTAQAFADAGADAKPVGQLWLVKLVPVQDGQPVPSSKVRMVHVRAEDHENEAACYALGVSKKAGSGLELLVYGKDKEPVLRVPLKASSGQQENPIELSAERTGDNAVLTLKFVGKYEGSFELTPQP
jgi:hypothetical protein